jgi:hypothetical protein
MRESACVSVCVFVCVYRCRAVAISCQTSGGVVVEGIFSVPRANTSLYISEMPANACMRQYIPQILADNVPPEDVLSQVLCGEEGVWEEEVVAAVVARSIIEC